MQSLKGKRPTSKRFLRRFSNLLSRILFSQVQVMTTCEQLIRVFDYLGPKLNFVIEMKGVVS